MYPGSGWPYQPSLLLGWWGVSGLTHTPQCLATNLGGGKDVTELVVPSLLAPRYDPSLGY